MRGSRFRKVSCPGRSAAHLCGALQSRGLSLVREKNEWVPALRSSVARCTASGTRKSSPVAAVMPRAGYPVRCGFPVSITGVSGILDRPHARAMMVGICVRVLAALIARGLLEPCRSFGKEGAGKAGCALHPRSRMQMHKEMRTRAYRFSGGNPAFPARWFYGFLRALPGDRAFLPPSPCGSLHTT